MWDGAVVTGEAIAVADVADPSEETSFSDMLDDWLASNDFSDATGRTYRDSVKGFLSYCKPWKGSWQRSAIAWRKSLEQSAVQTQRVYVAAAKGYCNWCIMRGLLDGPNALDSVRFRGATNQSKRRALTDDEVDKLLASCDRKTPVGLRDYAVLMVSLHTAVRISGVAGLCIEDIEKREGVMVMRYQCKGHRAKDRQKVLVQPVVKAIMEYLQSTKRKLGSTGPVFLTDDGALLTLQGLRKSLQRRFEACGIVDASATIHSLRHTAASKALDAGADLPALKELMDHKSLMTTERYLHVSRALKEGAELSISYQRKGRNV